MVGLGGLPPKAGFGGNSGGRHALNGDGFRQDSSRTDQFLKWLFKSALQVSVFLGLLLLAAIQSTPAHALGPSDINLRLITGDDLLGVQELTPDSNQCPAQGPVAAFVAYEITNTSGGSLSSVQATMSGLDTGQGFGFGNGQPATIVVGAMGAGESRVVSWFVAHPCAGNTPVSDAISVTVSDSDPGSMITNLVLEARSSISSNAGGVVTSIAYSPNPGAVGADLFLEVDHSFGNVQSGDQFILQPAGGSMGSLNSLTGFRADCYELIGVEVLSSTIDAVPAGTANQMFFVAGASQNGTGFLARVRYIFIPLCGSVGTTFDPYAQETSGNANLKYTNGGTTAIVTPPEISVLIDKVASPGSFAFGEGGTVTYTVTLTNTAPADVRISEIEDILPAGFVFDAISAGSEVTSANSLSVPTNGDTGTITFVADGITTGDPYLILANGGTLTLIYTVTVPSNQAVGAYDNSVTARVGNETVGPASDTVTITPINVSISKAAAPTNFVEGAGGTVTYTATITNSSTSSVSLTEIEDVLPVPLIFDSIVDALSDVDAGDLSASPSNGDGGALTFALASPLSIAAGASIDFVYTATVPTNTGVGDYDNAITALVNGQSIGPTTARVSVTPLNASISKVVTPTSFVEGAGGAATYTATITNNSAGAITLTEIDDVLPSPFTFGAIVDASSDVDAGDLSASPDLGDSGALSFVLTNPLSIAAGASINFVYTADVPTSTVAGTYDNSISAVTNGTTIGPAVARVTVTPLTATISKLVTPTSFVQGSGGTVTYTATITNSSAAAVSLTQIEDVLPSPFTFGAIVDASSDIDAGDLSASPSNGDGGTLTFTLAAPLSIAAGASADFVYTANVPANTAAGAYDNSITAVVNGSTIGPAVARVTITSLNATISKSVTPSSLVEGAGGTVTYTSVINNNSAKAVSLTRIDDALPSPFTFGAIVDGSSDVDASDLSSGPTNGDGGALSFILASPVSIPAGGSVMFVYTAEAPISAVAGNYDNSITAEINGATIGPAVARVTITPLAVAIQKTVNPTSFVEGDGGVATYTATITNNSAAAVSLTEIVDDLPAPFTFDAINNAVSDIDSGDLSASPSNGDGGTLTFTLTNPLSIAAGASVAFVYTATVPTNAAVGNYDNSLTAEVNNTEIGPAVARVTITAAPVIDVSITKTVSPTNFVQGAGGTVTYTATITNNSAVATDLTRVDDALPSPFTFAAITDAVSDVNAADLSSAPGSGDTGALAFVLAAPVSIAAGASIDFVYTANIPTSATAGTYDNSISAVVEGETVGPAIARVTITPLTVSITKSSTPNSFVQGAAGLATYTATITNNSAAAVSLTQIDDALPAPFQFNAIVDASSDINAGDLSAGPANGDTGALSFVLTTPRSIAAGDSLDFIYTATIPTSASAGNYDNSISAEVNNTTIGPATTRVTITPLNVTIQKIVMPTSFVEGAGGVATYTATISNNSASSVSLTQIDDTLPASFAFAAINNALSDIDSGDLSASPSAGATGAITFILTNPLSIPAGGSATFTYTVNIPTSIAVGQYDNAITTQVNGDTIGPAVARVTITPLSVGITKSATPSSFVEGAGGLVTYTSTISNNSAQAVSLTQIQDALPAPFTFGAIVNASSGIDSGDLSSSPANGATGALVFMLSSPLSIPANGSVTFVYTANVPASAGSGNYDNSITAQVNGETIGPAVSRVAITPIVTSIQKFVTPSSFVKGAVSTVTYTVRFTNNSSSAVDLTEVDDTLPAPFTFAAIDGSSDIGGSGAALSAAPSPGDANLSFVLAAPLMIASGASVDLVYSANVNNASQGAYDNSVTATANGVEIGPATARVTITPLLVDIEKEGTPNSFLAGDGGEVIYTTTITNNSGSTVTLTEIQDTLPALFEFVEIVDASSDIDTSDLAGGGPSSGATGTLIFGLSSPRMLASGESVNITYKIDIPQSTQPGAYDNSVVAIVNGETAGPATDRVIISPNETNVTIRKDALRSNVSLGDLVPYQVEVFNNDPIDRTDVAIVDNTPLGFSYVSGTGAVDGVSQEPIVNGSELVWGGLTLPANGSVVIDMLLSVGPNVRPGIHVNRAFARQFETRITEIAEAAVVVVVDPTFDCAEVIGTVFPDYNGNGYQDEGEVGLPGVRVVTVNGLLVTTDEFGRYHVACAAVPNPRIGSNFIMKLDERTLPQGFYVTTENPRAIRLTRGKTSKLNFGVSKKSVVEVKLNNSPSPKLTNATPLETNGKVETPSEPRYDSPGATAILIDETGGGALNNLEPGESANSVGHVIETGPGGLSPEQLSALVEKLKENPSELRITYSADPDEFSSAQAHARKIGEEISNEWQALADAPPLTIETRLQGTIGDHVSGPDNSVEDFISMSFDGLKAKPILNVDIDNEDTRAVAGTAVDFVGYWNYGYWIDHAEVRIFNADQSDYESPMAIVPMTSGRRTNWHPEITPPGQLQYVLRVYDSEGRYDETQPKPLEFISEPVSNTGETSLHTLRGYGVDLTRVRNIPVDGGTITVFGKDLPAGTDILVGGQPTPVSEEGTFVHEAIFPAGNHDIDVTMLAGGRAAYRLQRTAFIPKDDWFLVALGDLTAGKNFNRSELESLTGDDNFDDTYVHGRAAFYLKGKIRGKYILTAAYDSGDPLNASGPSQLLRRLDPERFYPVYGDDSTATQDAPTRGKFYVRLERGESRILWGNFVTKFVDTELSQMGRGLYGAYLRILSPETTSFGEARYRVEGFGAEPGTIPAREEFRGTGGSVFFLERQNVAGGSERIRIETRDKDSGLIMERKDLAPGKDYDFDYIQGRVLLNRPLSSTVLDDWLVRDGSLSGDQVFLVVQYEYRPGIGSFEGMSVGGRASGWLGETLQLGVTGQKEETGVADQQLLGADAKIRIADNTYIGGEVSRTRGPTFTNKSSIDGGFRFSPLLPPGDLEEAFAYRLEGKFDSADFAGLGEDTKVSTYFEHRDAGFAAPGRLTLRNTDQWGVALSTSLPFGLDLAAEYDALEIEAGAERTALNVDLKQHFGENWSLGVGWRFSEINNPLFPTSANQGQRNDGAVQLAYDDHDDINIYAFAQGTLNNDDNRTRNDRVGLGAKVKVTNSLDLNGEVSTGNLGLGALAGLNYRQSDNAQYYLAYELAADRVDTGARAHTPIDLGGGFLTLGSKQRLSDTVSVYGEERVRMGEAASGVTHVYGVDYNPDEKWVFGASIENGALELANTGNKIERTAATLTIGYSDDGASFVTSAEIRLDDEAGEDRSTYVSRSTLDLDVDDDWRFISRLNMLFSDSEKGEFYDGRFIEASAGFAYRPIKNDRFNLLSKYTLFYDLPSPGQIAFDGSLADYKQRSHIFSIDGIYDLNTWLSVGAKYGVKIGKLTSSRVSDDFFSSTAHLGVVRLDAHFVHDWDFMIERHYLRVNTADDGEWGTLLAIYRHLGDNLKIGAGYNFSNFSGDLTNLDFDDRGVFVNIIGKL